MNPETHYRRGKACFGSGQNDEALKHYNNALELDPEYAPAYRGKAEASARIGYLWECCRELRNILRSGS